MKGNWWLGFILWPTLAFGHEYRLLCAGPCARPMSDRDPIYCAFCWDEADDAARDYMIISEQCDKRVLSEKALVKHYKERAAYWRRRFWASKGLKLKKWKPVVGISGKGKKTGQP